MPTSPGYLRPFFFAWVEPGEEFSVHHHRVDEEIFDFVLKHDEGQIPTLDLTIKNPRVGLLAPGRPVWAWFSYEPPSGSGVIPLFYGVLLGVPSNLFQELITIQLQARPSDYIAQRQAVAETMKHRPNWDPVFLDEKHRDDPDAILEGWSSLWHVDRTSLVVTASDILEGEDGTVTFEEDDAFYDGVTMNIGQAPLTNVQVQATVSWTQRSTSYVDGPDVNVRTYTGDTFLGEWPKAGAGLGGGWRVEESFVNDVYQVGLTPMVSSHSEWHNTDPGSGDGSTESFTSDTSWPAILSPNPLACILTEMLQSGITDPDSDPPINRPAVISVTGMSIPLWYLNCTWRLRYDAKRDYTEYLFFDVIANTQAILTSPTIDQNTEVITLNGSNVGEPLLEVDAWTDFRGQFVPLTTLVYQNDPTVPGGTSYQICVVEGTAGTTPPEFSNVPGTITTDGGVQWASLGQEPLSTEPDWSDSTEVPLGEIIYYVPKAFNVGGGDWEDIPSAGTFLLCVNPPSIPSRTNNTVSTFTYMPPAQNNDEAVPAPVVVSYIAGPGGMSIPGGGVGTGTIGTERGNGTTLWKNLGQHPALLGLPVGGTMTNVTARSYFPTDRGLWSVEYLICKARARLRMRARAVTIGWDCPFDNAIGLSCRHNATLFDPRLPGGVATGKVVTYTLSTDGDTGELKAHVEIGCSIGFAGSVSDITGTPEYAQAGYMQHGYQRYDGGFTSISDQEIAYTPPIFTPFDDGLSFPLRSVPTAGSPTGDFSGDINSQAAAITAAFPASISLDNQGSPNVSGSAWWLVQQDRYWTAHAVPYVMEANPVRWDFYIKPVTNGPFNGAYGLTVTQLEVPQGINLLAPSEI